MSSAQQQDEQEPQPLQPTTVMDRNGNPVMVAPNAAHPDTLSYPWFQPPQQEPAPAPAQATAQDPNAGPGQAAFLQQMAQHPLPVPEVQKPAEERVPDSIKARPAETPAALRAAEGAPQQQPAPADSIDKLEHKMDAHARVAAKAYSTAANMEIAANNEMARVQEEKNAELIHLQENQMREQNRLETEAAQAAMARKEAQQHAHGVVTRLAEKQAATAFDPDRWSKNQGEGGRLAAGIAIALGQFGAALTHSGSNAALGIIESAIERDVDAQKTAYARGEQVLAHARTDYQELVQQGFGEKQAEDALRAAAWTRAQRMIDVTGAQYGGAEAQARAQQLNAVVSTKTAEHTNAVVQYADSRAIALEGLRQQQAAHQAAVRAAMEKGPPKVSGEQAEKIDANINGLKALLGTADKFHKATGDNIPGGNIIGQLSGSGDTAQYQRLREISGGAIAGIQDPSARMQPALIQGARDSLPDVTTTSHSAGMANFANQYNLGRQNLLTRIQTEQENGRDASPYIHQLQAMDKEARDLGIMDGGIKRREAEGGR